MTTVDVSSHVERIKDAIESAIVNIDDLSFAILQEASRNQGVRPAADKTLVQARRALEKASRLLESLEERD